METTARLTDALVRLLDGTSLETKVGATLLLVTAEDSGTPRVAALSVGEVLATSETELVLTLYAGSRTTAALLRARAGLLLAVEGGALVRVGIAVVRVEEGTDRTIAVASVTHVERDAVAYAAITRGIEFELSDEEETVARWRRQVARMREAAGS
jgi:hypothetical protein